MLLDWFTVAAQTVNFLVLVYLLKRFLYGPIIKAIDEREKRIHSRLAQADTKMKEAEQKASALDAERAAFDDQQQEMFAKAKKNAEKLENELVVQAKAGAAAAKTKWLQALDQEKVRFLREIRQRAGAGVVKVVERILQDMAGEELEEMILDRFLDRVRTMPPDEKKKLEDIIARGEDLVVRFSIEAPQYLAKRISSFFQTEFSVSKNFVFEKTEDLVAGIELISQDHKVSFSIADYLEQLYKELDLVVAQKELTHAG